MQLSLAEANRDPARFSDPQRFDITRDARGALGFGHGPHSCIGVGLARMQAATAIESLLRRAPDLARDPEREVAWWALAGIQGPEALGVRVTAAPAARPAR